MDFMFYIVENGELSEYKRIGECCACGECCCKKKISFEWKTSGAYTMPDNEEIDDDWSEWEGFSLFWHYGIWWYFKITAMKNEENVCSSFVNGKCNIFMNEKEFPPICRFFPFHPNDIKMFDKCPFRFEKLEDGTILNN